jgi:hypothetical protein
MTECEGVETHQLQVPRQGLELGVKPSGKAGVLGTGGAESGAVDARNAPIDAELARLIDAWPKLPEATREDILALAQAGVSEPSKVCGGKP